MTNIQELTIPDVKILLPTLHQDARGYFTETVNEKRFLEGGIKFHSVQENQSMSHQVGTVRGLHFQRPPYSQAKLVRVLRGRVFDVAVDLRSASPTYGKHVSAILSADDIAQIFIPTGFAHGFCTLTEDAIVLYKTSDFYVPQSESGIIWNDPMLGIDWPIDAASAVLSDKDAKLPPFKELSAIQGESMNC